MKKKKIRLISPRFIGNFAYCIGQFLIRTLRCKIYSHPAIEQKQQYIYAFWHDKQFAAIMLMPRFGSQKKVGLVSPSRDGEMLSVWLTRMGYEVVRGSSSKKSISSLVKLLDKMKAGYTVGIAADGPRGPRHEAKAGVAFLAHKSGVKIVPMGVAFTPNLCFKKSWDQYQLPLPFSKTVIYVGKPIEMPDLQDIESINERMADVLKAADKKAARLLAGEPETVVLGEESPEAT